MKITCASIKRGKTCVVGAAREPVSVMSERGTARPIRDSRVCTPSDLSEAAPGPCKRGSLVMMRRGQSSRGRSSGVRAVVSHPLRRSASTRRRETTRAGLGPWRTSETFTLVVSVRSLPLCVILSCSTEGMVRRLHTLQFRGENQKNKSVSASRISFIFRLEGWFVYITF